MWTKRRCSGRVTRPEQRGSKIQVLVVVDHVDVAEAYPRAVLDPEVQGQPVRHVDHVLVLDLTAGDRAGEPVVEAGDVGPGIVDPVSPSLRERSTRGEVAVPEGAEGLAEALLARVESFVGERPGDHSRSSLPS